MLANVLSAVNIGLDSRLVEVETDVGRGRPLFEVVGLPDKAVSEAKERVRSAIINSGLEVWVHGKGKRIIINLAPADIKKEGSVYDLPIALGILAATGQINPDKVNPKENMFIGELALNGELRHTKGVLPMALLARRENIKNIYIPEKNIEEATLVDKINIYPVKSLKHLLDHFSGKQLIKSRKFQAKNIDKIANRQYQHDFGYIKGQNFIKRALEIAAAGGHNVMMVGVPGSGKTLLAKSMPSIFPKMTNKEVLEVTKIYSVSGLLKQDQYLKHQRPFRSPHHTTSDVAMVGGGQVPRPGEVSLAHRGVLFLDELTHFNRMVLESLRQPLEDGEISVSRARGSIQYPAKFVLIASMNPCACGYYGDKERECNCSAGEIIRYRRKISGPLLDRIDLHLSVPRVKIDKLMDKKVSEESGKIRDRVESARKLQAHRFKDKQIITNSEMTPPEIKQFCDVNKQAEQLIKTAMEKFALSARAYHRILKVARTIADLASDKGREEIKPEHIAEAIQYRIKTDHYDF